jgi:hypothetical protein
LVRGGAVGLRGPAVGVELAGVGVEMIGGWVELPGVGVAGANVETPRAKPLAPLRMRMFFMFGSDRNPTPSSWRFGSVSTNALSLEISFRCWLYMSSGVVNRRPSSETITTSFRAIMLLVRLL